jgi:acyl-CoA synthetase (AMP-forming)/AMP-acid ligase II/thioesterase domain-containing protein
MLGFLSECGAIKDIGLNLRWDAATLSAEVHRRATVLVDRGIGRGSVVAILHSGTARFFADLFATWSVGATAACLDSSLTPGEIQNVVDFSSTAILLTDGGAPAHNFSIPVLELDGMSSSSHTDASSASAYIPDDPALLLFTSGTTGTPKGVVLTFKALSARVEANIAAIGANTLRRALVTLPTFFGHGLIGNSLTPLLAGGEIVLHPRGMALINNLGSILDENDISFMSSVPSLWRLALTCSPQSVRHSLIRVHVGSAPLSAALWSEIAAWSGADVVNCYGITETANWIAGASSRTDGINEGLVGKMWGGSATVMNESGAVCDRGAGEILIRSGCLMSGYLKRQDLTDAAFVQGWFRTGDLGSIDDQDRIWVTGRLKDEINRGGFKVQPAEVDSLLETHPAVAEACVFGIPDPMGGEAVAAAIRLVENEPATALGLQAWCSERLRRAAVPEHWFFVSEIPRTARGKVSREIVRRTLTQDADVYTVKSETESRSVDPVLAIAATFILDPLLPALRFSLQADEFAFDVRPAPYNQVFQELRSPASMLATNTGGIDVVIVRLEDFIRDIRSAAEARATIRQTASELRDALNYHLERSKVPTLFAALPPSPRVPKALRSVIDEANEALYSHARSLLGVTLITQEDVDRVSSDDRYDTTADELAHTPFTEAHYASIALAIAQKVGWLRGRTGTPTQPLTSGRSVLEALRAQGVRPRSLPGTAARPANEMEHRLLSLWQEILGIDGLGVEDDYFALGGSSLMAARLFAEIARRFAVRLPLSTILEAPTVRTLSHHLERKRSSPAGSLVDLRPGGPRTLFIVHDGVGETLLYLNLARRLPTDFAVVGIGPRRLPGIPLAHTRVEDMAAFYLVEIRKKQAHGPYFLAGMCAGGVIAYEMAAQLLDAGESVELVALFDAVTPQATKRTRPIVEQRPGPVKRELAELNESKVPLGRGRALAMTICQRLVNALSWRISYHGGMLLDNVRFALLRKLLARDNGWPGFVPELGFQKILSRAQAQYLPKPLSISSILLVRATSGEGADTPYTKLYVDDTLGWAAVAKNLAIADVDGGHESMLQESFVGSLASALTPYIEKKSARPRPRVVEPTTT